MALFDKHGSWGGFFLRLGFAATLWYAAWQHAQHLDEAVKMLRDAHVPGASVYLVWALVAFLIVSGMSVVFRFLQSRFALLLSIFFIITLITVPWTEAGAVWKDLTLLGASLWLLF